MDPCNCWDFTKITLVIKHCPSLTMSVRTEIDKTIRFVQEQTKLSSYGKVTFSELQEAQRSSNDVPNLPA